MLVKRENSYSHFQVIDHRRESSSHEDFKGPSGLAAPQNRSGPSQPRRRLSFHLFKKNTSQRFFSFVTQYLVLGMNPCTVKKFVEEPRLLESLILGPKYAPSPQISPSVFHISPPSTTIHPYAQALTSSFLSLSLIQGINNPESSDSQLTPCTTTTLTAMGPKSPSRLSGQCTHPLWAPCLHSSPVCSILQRSWVMSFRSGHSSVQNPPFASHHTKPQVFPVASENLCHLTAVPYLLTHSALAMVLPCFALNIPSSFPPQELCPCNLLCLECSSPRPPHGALPCFIATSTHRSPPPRALL